MLCSTDALTTSHSALMKKQKITVLDHMNLEFRAS